MLSGMQKAKPSPAEPEESFLGLLAHYELADPETGSSRSGFAVILELETRRVLVEGDVAFSAGQRLDLAFFLPNHEAESRVNVHLSCEVAQCRDEERLHYSLRVAKASNASKAAIEDFLKQGDSR